VSGNLIQFVNEYMNPKSFICTECPHLWSILNQKARRELPPGFREYLNGNSGETGQAWLKTADRAIRDLFEILSEKEVGDCYRRYLSAIGTARELAQRLCEITLAAELSKLSSQKPVLSQTHDSGTSCDVKVTLEGTDVYAEYKRLEDPGPCGQRAIVRSPVGQKPENAQRPRSMDLHSKLEDVHRQFPQGTVNIVFLSHPSYADSKDIVRQALFGGSFSAGSGNVQRNGLFANEEWATISACVLAQIGLQNGPLTIIEFWDNPEAERPVPKEVRDKLAELTTK